MSRVLARTSVVVDVETTAGTYQVPTKVLKIESAVLPDADPDIVEVANYSFFGGTSDSLVIMDWAKGSFEVTMPLYKSLSYYETLFDICNLKKTAVTTPYDGFAYTPETHGTATASVDIVLPDRKFKYQGAKAGFKFSGKVGEKITCTFSLSGNYVGQTVAPQTIVDVEGDEMMLIRRLGGMSINGTQINLSEFELDMGNVLEQDKYTNVGEFHMSDYLPKLIIKTRLETAGSDGFDALSSGDGMEFVCDLTDTEGNLIWRLNIPKAKISVKPAYEDSNGIFAIQREYKAVSTVGDDNFTLYHFTH